jgi:glutaredoxin 3
VREFLSARGVAFTERNVRQDAEARADLLRLRGELAVPVVVVGDRQVVGYDPEGLAALVSGGGPEGAVLPPRDSAWPEQGGMAARAQGDLAAMVGDLVARVREELAYNSAKGSGPYRQGMHDGLRFAEEALLGVLREYDGGVEVPEGTGTIRRMDA